MPVRIYDIAKKLGLENKEILAKAKEMGIAAAKVPSSSLDKISAGWLEEELVKTHPEVAAKLAPKPPPEPPKPPPVEEKIVLITAPPEPKPEVIKEPVVTAASAAVAPPPVVERPKPPPKPAGPKIGDKVGFVQLPQKPAPKTAAKTDSVKLPSKPAPHAKRAGRPAAPPSPKAADKAPVPAAPKFVVAADAETIVIKPPIVVRELAAQLGQKPFKIIADLMETGVFANVNQAIDEKIARQVCAKYGFRFEVEKRERGSGIVHAPVKTIELDPDDKPEDLRPRAPVVTIMGHVDHGKTSLLDVIRKSDVAAGESGGITQHIGAYTISVPHPERKNDLAQITFLDTPGHAAFSSMRARGANVTDLVVLVIAANDGVMPQTIEALNHAKAAKVPILVAVNKIDHPNANSMKVRQQLQEKGLAPDDWGGDTIFVECSALTKQGIDKLLEMILLQADLLELKANPNRRAKGNVIESGVEPGGPTATVLVRKGTLRLGDVILCGEYYGRVRALINEEGRRLKEAGPSVAVKVLGLNGVPEAGLEFSAVEDEKAARDLAEERSHEIKTHDLESRSKVTLENLFASLEAAQSKTLKVVVKADMQGSVEAIVEALQKIESVEVTLEIIHSDVGTITENDVSLASASNAVILGFHTRVDSTAAEKAKREGVQIKLFSIIYELIDQVKESLAGLLAPVIRENVIGSAEVRQIFELSKGVPVAGCMVANGRIVKGKARVRRRKDVIYEGILQSLRRFQDEVNEVRAGMECGIRIEGFSEYQIGDAIECYTVEKVAAKL
jgi:translation initiation factor IF-2